jgi:hypothetical protein
MSVSRAIRSALLTLSVAASTSAFAQQHVNRDRGFVPNRSYDFGAVDNVNLFNGNLVVTIPIGPEYRVGGSLSYRLTLVHSGNVWSMQRILSGTGYENPVEEQYPNPRSNAGLGWQLSLGQMITPADPYNSSPGEGAWVYMTPHGSEHSLGNDAVVPNPGLGIRRSTVGTKQRLEHGDGTVQTYDAATGRLEKIEDRFGYWVTVDYQGTEWTIRDSSGRVHYVAFTTPPDTTAYGAVLDRVELAGFAGSRTSYTFGYTQKVIARGCEHSTLYNVPVGISVPLLTSIAGPGNITYAMGYVEGDPAQSFCAANVGRWASGAPPVRTEYRLYDEDRIQASRTVFDDDCVGGTCRYLDIHQDAYDGYGHYRQTSTDGNLSGANVNGARRCADSMAAHCSSYVFSSQVSDCGW